MWEWKRKIKKELEDEIRELKEKLRDTDWVGLEKKGVLRIVEEGKKLEIGFLGDKILIDVPRFRFRKENGGIVKNNLKLVILKYLLGAESLAEGKGDYLSLSEMGINYEKISNRIGRAFYLRGKEFLQVLESLGGKRKDTKSQNVELEVLPYFSFLLVFDEGSEEKPPGLRIEGQKSYLKVFGVRELIYVLLEISSKMIKKGMEILSE